MKKSGKSILDRALLWGWYKDTVSFFPSCQWRHPADTLRFLLYVRGTSPCEGKSWDLVICVLSRQAIYTIWYQTSCPDDPHKQFLLPWFVYFPFKCFMTTVSHFNVDKDPKNSKNAGCLACTDGIQRILVLASYYLKKLNIIIYCFLIILICVR